MSKKQVFLMSLLAALPAAFLMYVLIMSAVDHGANVFSGMKWLFWGLAALGGAIAAFAPILIMLLYPAQGFAPAMAAPLSPVSVSDAEGAVDDDELTDNEVGFEDEGEQLFEDDAMGDEFDDELEVGFDDDDDNEKY